ncbi:efflux RND transporter periplasmic adaptor subunit [Halanaerobium hydrogeniformans]|uniref:Efflux transporter, RND family, MFP subunit n=1 Tax=Halanaerobium hydrogeniformans TaxID=656519 RepID=E4RMY9_HALHG|nr:efflux RND transporter periplasmic adaptor subunit [Halanaerobium hydrogeniformans]ADQ14206.1 efflux transporter, RND family, MFP subunit [Halanaerobium hydrogeniformans]
MKKNFKKYLIIALIIIVGIAALLLIIQLRNREAEKREELDLGVPVETYQLRKDDLEIILNYSGTVSYLNKARIFPQTQGEIIDIYVEEGQNIEAGEVLAKLDDREIRNNLSQAEMAKQETELAYKKAELSLENSKNNLVQSRAALNEAKSDLEQWRKDYQRDKKLYEEDVIARVKFEQKENQYLKARSRVESLEAALNIARTAITIAESDLEIRESQLNRAESELENARIRLDNTEVKAPFSGIILDKISEKGEMAASSQPIFLVSKSVEQIEVESHIGMSDLNKIAIGTEAEITFSNLKGEKFRTEISEISPISNPQNRTPKIKFKIDNREQVLKDGMAASLKIIADKIENELIIPNQAIFEFRDQAHVYVIKDSQAELRKIEPGISDGHSTVVEGGLNENEIVAVSNINELRDGAAVYLRSEQIENGDD